MLYSNQQLVAQEITFDFGTIFQVHMGEKGRGRRLLALTCPQGTIVDNGMNKLLTIGSTKSGRPRIINEADDNNLFLLLSSQGGYTRRGCGYIQVLKSCTENFKVLASGNGADGDAGRIGTWSCRLIQAPKNGIVRVRTSGAGYGTPSDIYILSEGDVYHCTPDNLSTVCDNIGIEMPCTVTEDNKLDPSQWETI